MLEITNLHISMMFQIGWTGLFPQFKSIGTYGLRLSWRHMDFGG